MKIFMTGPTGVLGRRVVKLLVDQGHQVVGLARTKAKAELLKTMKADFAQIDLFNVDELVEATKACDAIFHLATSIPQKPMPKLKDWQMNDKIRVEGTKNLIVAAQQNNITKFIGQSITALYGQQKGRTVHGNTSIPKSQIKMLESAAKMEEIIEQGMGNSHIILRFGTFYSADAYHTQDMLHNIKNGKLPLIGRGDFYWNFIHADDAACSIVFFLEHFESMKGKTLNVTDFQPIESRELLAKVRMLTHGKKPMKLPHWLVKLVLGKDVYGFLTNSYRIAKDSELNGFELRRKSYLSEIESIVPIYSLDYLLQAKIPANSRTSCNFPSHRKNAYDCEAKSQWSP